MSSLDQIYSTMLAIKSLDKRRREYKHVGWVYAARNPALKGSLIKVGKTSRYPTLRMQELSSTSLPQDFQLVYYVHVSNYHQAEAYAHQLLDAFLIADNREFFDIRINQAVTALNETAEAFPILMGSTRNRWVLQQDFGQQVVITCPACGKGNRIQPLPLTVRMRCWHCKIRFETG